mmetsp:Transcript_3357/g.5005  ORF Transcript_3357/g.5005 Transcript_3357/m.5005 type:complete len:361 (+) Transcript_3357:158-1240(+)|eukprot:CAMPEP_0194210772 /NCGR_PEP_ID=MMETSP0156-20130528/9094_1 /TAXON_ID=33649 /ORGANISM="Thalassionema nitzschioides, Strain L26-B" /LENGTH=360 /DNA_ID=CAMNT_0038938155 /DNA_START=122 /DNA_END=1204 /DNA_ORIENTATION=-
MGIFRRKKKDEEIDAEQPKRKFKYTVPDSPVYKTWCLLFVTSIVALISIGSQKPITGHETWVAIATAVSFAVSVIMLFGYNVFRESVKGSKTEGFVGLIIFIFWIAAIPSTMHLTHVTAPNGISSIVNANLYFSAWASFGVSVYLFVQILPNIVGERFGAPEDAGKTARVAGLFITSIVLLASAIEYATDFCSDGTGSTCSRNGYAIFVGIAGIVIPLIALILKALNRMNRLMEVLFSVLMFIVYIFVVGFVTFGEGPGSLTISNLYFAPWIGFIFSSTLAFESIEANRKYRAGGEAEEEEEEDKEEDFEAQESAWAGADEAKIDNEKGARYRRETDDYSVNDAFSINSDDSEEMNELSC